MKLLVCLGVLNLFLAGGAVAEVSSTQTSTSISTGDRLDISTGVESETESSTATSMTFGAGTDNSTSITTTFGVGTDSSTSTSTTFGTQIPTETETLTSTGTDEEEDPGEGAITFHEFVPPEPIDPQMQEECLQVLAGGGSSILEPIYLNSYHDEPDLSWVNEQTSTESYSTLAEYARDGLLEQVQTGGWVWYSHSQEPPTQFQILMPHHRMAYQAFQDVCGVVRPGPNGGYETAIHFRNAGLYYVSLHREGQAGRLMEFHVDSMRVGIGGANIGASCLPDSSDKNEFFGKTKAFEFKNLPGPVRVYMGKNSDLKFWGIKALNNQGYTPILVGSIDDIKHDLRAFQKKNGGKKATVLTVGHGWWDSFKVAGQSLSNINRSEHYGNRTTKLESFAEALKGVAKWWIGFHCCLNAGYAVVNQACPEQVESIRASNTVAAIAGMEVDAWNSKIEIVGVSVRGGAYFQTVFPFNNSYRKIYNNPTLIKVLPQAARQHYRVKKNPEANARKYYASPVDIVQFQTQSGHYLCADALKSQAKIPLVADRTEPQTWETFLLFNLGGNYLRHGNLIALRSYHRTMVVAEEGGTKEGAAVNANRLKIGAWERFRIYRVKKADDMENDTITDGDSVYLKIKHNGHERFLCASDGGGKDSILITRQNCPDKEKLFTIKVTSWISSKYVDANKCEGVYFGETD